MKYVKIHLKLVVKASDEDAVVDELNEALDLIQMEHTIYTDDITTGPTRKPKTADELNAADGEEDDG